MRSILTFPHSGDPMKQILIPALFSALGMLAGAQLPQEPAQDPGDGASMMEIQMEMMRLAQPGPEHEQLAKGEGAWVQTATLTMPPMGGMDPMPPMTSTARSQHEMVLGGRWMRMVTEGTMMGQKVESITYVGYDRRRDEYVTVGFDTMGTYHVAGRGKRGEDGIIRMYGTDDDGFGGQDFSFEIDDSDPARIHTKVIFTKLAGQVLDPPHTMVDVVQTRPSDG